MSLQLRYTRRHSLILVILYFPIQPSYSNCNSQRKSSNRLILNPDFKKIIQDDYKAQQFSFSKSTIEQANQKLDHWVSDKTIQRIKEVHHLTDDVMVVLLMLYTF